MLDIIFGLGAHYAGFELYKSTINYMKGEIEKKSKNFTRPEKPTWFIYRSDNVMRLENNDINIDSAYQMHQKKGMTCIITKINFSMYDTFVYETFTPIYTFFTTHSHTKHHFF